MSGENEGLDALRKLLLAPEQSELDTISERLNVLECRILDTHERVLVVGEVLPDAVRQTGGSDTELQSALLPEVEQVLHLSIRNDPNVVAEALYPVMGPVIRKIVEKLFESAKSPSLKPYNVEQLFLIHRNSGLVLSHEVARDVASHDADMVSGMLDAIRSFVQEAFDAHDFDGLRSMQVGDVNVRIEWSPLVVLAAVVRGIEPAQLQPILETSLAGIHRDFEAELMDFNGDCTPFSAVSPKLQEIFKDKALQVSIPFWKRHARPLALACLLLIITGIAAYVYNGNKWQSLLNDLSQEPGIVLLSEERNIGRNRLVGMRDPDSADPETVLKRNAFDNESVDATWASYYSDESAIKLKRAHRLLRPPFGAYLHVVDRQIFVYGTVPDNWFKGAIGKIASLDGIDRLVRLEKPDPGWSKP